MIYQFNLNEVEFLLIRDIIHENFGIYLREEKISFVKLKLYPRVVSLGMNSFSEYLNFVKYLSPEKKELLYMVSLITNNETYFFREYSQLKVFRDLILPELHERKSKSNEREIRILSAGCSTGDEAYTLAMLVYETGKFFWGWDIKIIGMDLNETALDMARQGFYYDRSFRMIEPRYLKKFFSANSGDYKIKEKLQNITRFIPGNITDISSWKTIGKFDVILCRNVLIYFSDEKIKVAIDNFYQALSDGGYLLLGHSETLTGISDDFKALRYPETVVYKKSLTGG